MKKYHALYLGLAFSIGIAGCSNKLECNSSEAKETVLTYFDDIDYPETVKMLNKHPEIKNSLKNDILYDIKTVDSDEKLGNYSCEAMHSLEVNDQKFTTKIQYRLEYLEDSKKSEVLLSRYSRAAVDSSLWGAYRAVELQNYKNVGEIIKTYEKDRGQPFSSQELGCINSKANEFNQKMDIHNKWTSTELNQWAPVCIKKVAEDLAKEAEVAQAKAKAEAKFQSCFNEKLKAFNQSEGKDGYPSYELRSDWSEKCTEFSIAKD